MVAKDPSSASRVLEPGLITQRMAAERGRAIGILWLIIGVGWLLTTSVNAMGDSQDWWFWPQIVGGTALGISFIVRGIAVLRARSKRVARFNAQHGEEAGRQE